MFANTKAYSGFAVDDPQKARVFYGGTLGLKTSEHHGLMSLDLPWRRALHRLVSGSGWQRPVRAPGEVADRYSPMAETVD